MGFASLCRYFFVLQLSFAGDHEFTAYGIGCATFTYECPEVDVDNVEILDVHVGVGTAMIVVLFECDGVRKYF